VARRYSIEYAERDSFPPTTRRKAFRCELPSEVERVAFGSPASEPASVEPFQVNGQWMFYRVYCVYPPTLDEETREFLAGNVFDEALRPYIADAQEMLRTKFALVSEGRENRL
jgi:hypothetical protein